MATSKRRGDEIVRWNHIDDVDQAQFPVEAEHDTFHCSNEIILEPEVCEQSDDPRRACHDSYIPFRV